MAGDLEAARDGCSGRSRPGPRRTPISRRFPCARSAAASSGRSDGAVASRFGAQATSRGLGGASSGIEVSAAEGRPVRAVHEGVVSFADVFPGIGQLVILDHGNLAYSLYGYLPTWR